MHSKFVPMTDEKENIDWKERFKNAFVLYLIRNGERPVTVFKFCEELGVDESIFMNIIIHFAQLKRMFGQRFIKR